MNFERRQYACGVVCLFTNGARNLDIYTNLADEIQHGEFEFALIYFSKSAHKPTQIVELMDICGHGIEYAACTTAGEVTPLGLVTGEILIILFPKQHFQIECCQIAHANEPNMENVIGRVSAMKSKLLDEDDTVCLSTVFAVCLIDGMSYLEEAITAALHWGLDDIPLLGGSAGDEMNFKETTLILNGEILESRAILMMFKSDLQAKIFKTENFIPRPEKLVVTHSDPNSRTVHELNGAPAADVYADVIGTDAKTLAPQSFASHPLVVRVGGEYYCRSIQKVNDDNSLTFFCAIDDGVVLTVAEPTGMAKTTQDAMKRVEENLQQIDFIMGFDCVLRQIDARNRQITQKISRIYRQNNVIGFNTYGEQYRSMHLNQTFTGIAFGIQSID